VHQEFDEISASFLQKARRGARWMTSSDEAVFNTLAGLHDRLPQALASDMRAREKVAGLLYGQYRSIRETRPLTHFRHVTILHEPWLTSDERTVLRLGPMFEEAERFLASLTGNFVAAADLQAFANVPHPDGGKLLTLHIHAGVWGETAFDVEDTLEEWMGQFEAIDPEVESIRIDPVGPRPKDLAKLAAYGLQPGYKCKTRFVHKETGAANLHESEKGDRYIRYHRLFELWSRINLRQCFRGGGEGASILEDIGEEMRAWVQEEKGLPVIDVSDVPDYWSRYRGSRPGERRFEPPIIIL
jgi:hypothetical protein